MSTSEENKTTLNKLESPVLRFDDDSNKANCRRDIIQRPVSSARFCENFSGESNVRLGKFEGNNGIYCAIVSGVKHIGEIDYQDPGKITTPVAASVSENNAQTGDTPEYRNKTQQTWTTQLVTLYEKVIGALCSYIRALIGLYNNSKMSEIKPDSVEIRKRSFLSKCQAKNLPEAKIPNFVEKFQAENPANSGKFR